MTKGQSLFEVVMALGLMTLIIVAVVILGAGAIRNSTFSKNNTASAKYADEATEWLRGQRDTNWNAFQTNIQSCPAADHVRCMSSLSWSSSCGTCSAGDLGGIFKREITFECRSISTSNPTGNVYTDCSDANVNQIMVDVAVSWTDGQGLHTTRSATNLSNWRIP